MLRRAANRNAPERGGYSAFCTYAAGVSQLDPAAHNFLRGNGESSVTPLFIPPASIEVAILFGLDVKAFLVLLVAEWFRHCAGCRSTVVFDGKP